MKHHKFRQTIRARLAALPGVLLLITILAALAAPGTARAQNYNFSVPELRMQVYVQDDASVRLVYDITFSNSTFADPIDIVDIGLPHDDYDIDTMSASIDGEPLTTIRPSTYIDTGVEIPLSGQKAIQPGEQGTLHFEATMPDMVYGDTTRAEYASLRITPTWFDQSVVRGSTYLRIAIHMLPGIEPDEVLYQNREFTTKALFEDHTVVVWEETEASVTGPYMVGVSFPERGISGVIHMNAFQLAVKWLDDNPEPRFFLLVLVVFLFAWLFFRFTGGTGCGLFGILALLFFFVLGNSTLHLISLIALPLLIFANEMLLMMRRSRATYLPAIAQVEGGGIKRGLTAAEAAIILEQPINRVLTLVIFGLLKKGVLRQTGAEPLTVELTEDFQVSEKLEPDQKENQRLKMAAKHQIVLHSYEHGFIDLIAENPNKPVHQIDFSKPMKKLIEHAAQRVKNFDLSDTRDYYRSIIKRALDEARSLEDEQQRNQNIDRNLEWILMNDGYRDTLDTRVRNRPYRYNPIWVRSPGYYSDRTGISKPLFGAGGGQSPSYGGTTSFSDVAASFAGWTENTFGSMADAISPGALQVEQSGGFVNLSGADKVTGDIFEALAKSSSSGGGSGGGCACACAGCACACACAGGGR